MGRGAEAPQEPQSRQAVPGGVGAGVALERGSELTEDSPGVSMVLWGRTREGGGGSGACKPPPQLSSRMGLVLHSSKMN